MQVPGSSLPLDMQALLAFLIVAYERSMSKAAERLGVTQSAISQAVRLLEDDIGLPLLNRSVRPLTLTPAGVALFDRGKVLVEEAINLRGAVIEASGGIKPSLRIGMVDSFAATCGTAVVQKLLLDTAQLAVRSGLSPALGEALIHREVDMTISTRPSELDNVVNHPLMSEKFLLIVPPDSKPVCRSVADIALLARTLPIVRFSQRGYTAEQIEVALRRLKMNLPNRLEVETADILTATVAGGIGWAVTTPLCLLQGVRSASLVRRDYVAGLQAGRELYLQTRKGEYESLTRDIFETIRGVLKHQVVGELKAIDPLLPDLVHVHAWTEAR